MKYYWVIKKWIIDTCYDIGGSENNNTEKEGRQKSTYHGIALWHNSSKCKQIYNDRKQISVGGE